MMAFKIDRIDVIDDKLQKALANFLNSRFVEIKLQVVSIGRYISSMN